MAEACHICGESENLIQVTIDGETIYLCPDCKAEHLKQCSQCDEYFIDTENDYAIDKSGDVYCESCRDESLTYSEHCGEYSSSDDFTHITDLDEWWCDDCASEHAYQCYDCGNWIAENHGDGETALCQSCFESNYTICDDCGDLIHNDNARFMDDGSYCEYCYEHNHATEVHEYGYEPRLNFQHADDEEIEHPLPYLGFELEAGGLATERERENIAESLNGKDGEETFYLKQDCSIPDNGVELVSHPITLKRHKELDWQSILAEMTAGGLRSHDLGEEGCGLHVHVSRNFLSDYRWMLVDWLVSKHQTEFELIARRKETHWARFKKSDGKSVKDIYGKSSGTRYQAVNFENRKTVEFRLFRGTLKYSTFMATLEIVDALVHWAKQVSISSILASKNAFRNFTEYLTANGELYANAVNYLNDKELI